MGKKKHSPAKGQPSPDEWPDRLDQSQPSTQKPYFSVEKLTEKPELGGH
jgi:hypothetical protein